ncbi:uncharacterized protein LOC132197311 [Neocloeon triangulifer]|uniref:uncharacterized protein LOC132197311 n=1 Tax=Neocloeon triangulifer TaxID=2078957 RepID=UPI00286F4790|nr:uncharacterized protein LOC132197311 [Neocloeon triangulifer]
MAGNSLKLVRDVLKYLIDARGFDRVMDKVTIVSAGQGKCVAEMVVGKEHENKGGTLHGGLTATLVDGISTLALMTHDKGVPGVSVDIHVSYLKAAKEGDKITIDAITKKAGNSLAFLDVQITNAATGAVIATGTHTKFVGENLVPIAPPIAEEEEEEQVMQPEDVLRPLKEDQVEKLLQVLATDLPDSSVPYNWIKKQTEWAKKLPEIKVSILCPDGDWSDGTVVTMVDGLGEKIVFGTLYTLEKGGAKLKKALTETKLIPWHRFSHFSGVHVRHIPICVEILSAVGVNLHTGNLYVPCHMHYASAEDAANIEIPELAANVRVGPLDLSHVDTVCKYWPHYSADYRRVVEKMVELNPSCGVFVRNEDGAEELAAMIVQSEYGGLGILQTVPEHRRKGYALTALRHQARALGRAGVSPHCHVIVDNYRSVELFKKSGLKPVALTNWVCAKRKEDRTLL